MDVDIRWMVRSDMPSVYQIERECFPCPWKEEHFRNVLRSVRGVGMVAEVNDRVVGYMIYERSRESIELLNFAVKKNRQRWGIGTAMVDRLKGKLTERRSRIVLNIHEENLAAHLFFRSQGFKATGIVHDAWDIHGDAYAFCYRVQQCVGV